MKKEELTKFYQIYKIYIFPIVVVFSSLFFIIFAIIPQIGKLVDNQKAIGTLTAKSEFLEAKAAVLETYDNGELAEKVQLAVSALPTEKDPVNIISFLQQVVTRSGFSASSIFPSSGNGSAKMNSYTVKIEVTGVKTLFQNLLDNLENSPRLIKVSSIILSDSGSQLLNATLELEVLYAAVPANFGTTDSPLPKIEQKKEAVLAFLLKVKEAAKGSEASPPTFLSPRGKSNPFE